MRPSTLAVLMTCSCLLAGCSSTIRVTQFDPDVGQEGKGAVYFLPKNLLQVRFNVNVTAHPGDTCATVLDDCASVVERQDMRLTTPQLVSVVLPDERAGFVLESDGTFVTETEFTAHFAENGALLDANATSSDQVLEAITWGVETYGKLFQGSVMAGSSELKATQQTALRRDLILKAMRLTNEQTAASLESGEGAAGLIATQIAMDNLNTELAALEARLTTEVSLPVICSIDPGDISISELDGVRVFHIDPNRSQTCPSYAWLQKWLQNSGLAYVPPLPAVKVRMVPQASVETSKTVETQWNALRDAAGKPGSDWIPGLVYRIPAWFDVSVTSALGPLLQETVAIPQLGQIAAITIGDSALRQNRSFQVTLYPNLGSIQELHYTLSAMDFEKATQAVDAIVDATTKKSQLEAEQLAAETARLQAEIQLMETQQAYDEALREAQKATQSPDYNVDFE